MPGCILIWRTDKKRSKEEKSAREGQQENANQVREREWERKEKIERERERVRREEGGKRDREREHWAEGGSWRDAGATRANHSAVSLDRERRYRRIDNRFAFVWLTIKFSYELGGRWTASDGYPLSPFPFHPLHPLS